MGGQWNDAHEQVFQRWKPVVAIHLGIDQEKVTKDSSYIDHLGADSLDIVELNMAAEEEFMVEISDDELERIDTAGDHVKVIVAKGPTL